MPINDERRIVNRQSLFLFPIPGKTATEYPDFETFEVTSAFIRPVFIPGNSPGFETAFLEIIFRVSLINPLAEALKDFLTEDLS